MSASTPSRRQPKRLSLRERAAALQADLDQARSQPAPEAVAQDDPPSLGTVRVAADAHPDTYGLLVDEGGLGLHAAPGAAVIVEPVVPDKAGLAVFYLKGRPTPVIFDLTHHFRPEFVEPFAPGSEVMPMVELCEPATGISRYLRADRIEKLHRITGIYTSAEIAEKQLPAPTPLPLVSEYPEGMGEHRADDTAGYPLVRQGETVVYDPAQREPTHGALCVLEWRNGARSLSLTNLRQTGGETRWWAAPVNRPPSREAMERRLAENAPGDMLFTTEGPLTAEHLRSKIVGTVVGVLVPWRTDARQGRPEPVTPELSQDRAEIQDSEPAAESDAIDADPSADENDAALLALGRQFGPAAARDLEACRAANEADRRDGEAPPEVEAEFVAAAEAAEAIAYRIAELPAHTAAGVRAKLRALAHYNTSFLYTRLPDHADPDQALAFSLAQDLRRTATEDAQDTATMEEAAELPFGAVDIDVSLRSPNEWTMAFSTQALAMHTADKTLRMDKAELVAFIRRAAERGDACDEAVFRAIECARETFEGYAKLLSLARTRYLVAAAAMTVENRASADGDEA